MIEDWNWIWMILTVTITLISIAILVYVMLSVKIPNRTISTITQGLIAGASSTTGIEVDASFVKTYEEPVVSVRPFSTNQHIGGIVLESNERAISSVSAWGGTLVSVWFNQTLELRFYESDVVWTVLYTESLVDYLSCGGYLVVYETSNVLWLTGDGGRGVDGGTLWLFTQANRAPTALSTGWCAPSGLAWDDSISATWIWDKRTNDLQPRLYKNEEVQTILAPSKSAQWWTLLVYQGTLKELGTERPLLTWEATSATIYYWKRNSDAWVPWIETPEYQIVSAGIGDDQEPRWGLLDGRVLKTVSF